MDVHEKLKDVVARMTLKNNYWGYLFSRVRRIPAVDLPSIMGVAPEKDATVTLYYHPELVRLTDEKVLTKIIEHEGLHLLNKHISRLLRILSDEFDVFYAGYQVQEMYDKNGELVQQLTPYVVIRR